MDSKRKPVKKYQNLIDMLNRAFERFRVKSRGEFKEKFDITVASRVLSQPPGNNLCGYYVCEFMHTQTGGVDRMLKEDKGVPQHLAEQGSSLSPARLRAIQEQLVGFIYDEVINPKGEFHEPNSNRWGPLIKTDEMSWSTSTATKSDAHKRSR